MLTLGLCNGTIAPHVILLKDFFSVGADSLHLCMCFVDIYGSIHIGLANMHNMYAGYDAKYTQKQKLLGQTTYKQGMLPGVWTMVDGNMKQSQTSNRQHAKQEACQVRTKSEPCRKHEA